MDTEQRRLMIAMGTLATAGIAALAYAAVNEARAHDWYPPNCCSGYDCKPIPMSEVRITPEGFVIPGNPETIPYSDTRIRQTPPAGEQDYHICTRGGKIDGKILCLYIPNWGA